MTEAQPRVEGPDRPPGRRPGAAPDRSAQPVMAANGATAETTAPDSTAPEGTAPDRTLPAKATRVGYRAALANREFRGLLLAILQSELGDQVGRVALASLVFQRTHSPASTALTYGLTFVPALVAGPLLSGLADLLPRRTIMIVCDVVRAVLFALMAWRAVPLWAIAVLLIVATLLDAPFSAATNALVPNMFDGDAYDVASGLRTTGTQSAQLVGFAVGGVVVAAFGPHTSLLIDAASFALSAGLTAVMIRQRPAAVQRSLNDAHLVQRSFGQSATGIRAAFGNPACRYLMLAVWLAGMLTVAEALAVPYVAEIHGPRESVGVLMAALPIGYVIGTTAYLRVTTTRTRPRVASWLLLATGLPFVAMLAHPDIVVSGILWFSAGLASAYMVYMMPTFARFVPDEHRGAAIGVASAGLVAAQGVAVWIFGGLADYVGSGNAIGWAGVTTVALAVALLLVARPHATARLTPTTTSA